MPMGKHARHEFPQNAEVSNKVLEAIHSNVWTTKTTSYRQHYYVSFIDDHTRKVWAYFMKHKSKVFNYYNAFKAMVEKEKGMDVKIIRSNEEEEYFSHEFNDYLKTSRN